MSPLLIGISAVMSLLLLAFLALTMRRKVRNTHEGVLWSMQDGARVLATITDVQIRQDWKEGSRWERSLWDGRLVRQKTWRTSYDVTAEWMDAQTKQRYFLRSKVWSDDVVKPPTPGQKVVFIVDLRHPERSASHVGDEDVAKNQIAQRVDHSMVSMREECISVR